MRHSRDALSGASLSPLRFLSYRVGSLPPVTTLLTGHVAPLPPAVFLAPDFRQCENQLAKRAGFHIFPRRIIPPLQCKFICRSRDSRIHFPVMNSGPICRAADKLCVVATAHPSNAPCPPHACKGALPPLTPTRERLCRPSSGLSPLKHGAAVSHEL